MTPSVTRAGTACGELDDDEDENDNDDQHDVEREKWNIPQA